DRVVVLRICNSCFPNRLARFGLECYESAIDHGSDDFSLVDRNASIHNAATDLGPDSRLINFRIPTPSSLPRASVDGEDHAPVCDPIQRAIPEERGCFLITASLPDVECPGQTE